MQSKWHRHLGVASDWRRAKGGISPDCFILEDHFQVGVMVVGFLRFGVWGNAGPCDVKCIASTEVRDIVGSLSVTGALSLTSILLPNLEVVRGSLAFTQPPMSFRLCERELGASPDDLVGALLATSVEGGFGAILCWTPWI